jgi:hypothetical protein
VVGQRSCDQPPDGALSHALAPHRWLVGAGAAGSHKLLRTATRAEIDEFAREVGLSPLAAVDAVRDGVRGARPSALTAEDEGAGGSEPLFHEHVEAANRLPDKIPSHTRFQPVGADSQRAVADAPYAHPIYWAAATLVGAG